MTADELLSHVTQATFFLLFLILAVRAIRWPRRSNIDSAVFFLMIAVIVSISWINDALGTEPGRLVGAFTASLLVALPYPLLRLADDFTGVRPRIMRGAEVWLALAVASLFLVDEPYPAPVILLAIGFFVAGHIYVGRQFINGGRRATGVARRRLYAVALGSGFIAALLIFIAFAPALPGPDGLWEGVGSVCSLGSAFAYFIGFAPPMILKRGWQAPGLGDFMRTAASSALLHGDTSALTSSLEERIAHTVGASQATISLWDASEGVLMSPTIGSASYAGFNTGTSPGYRCFESQESLFIEDIVSYDRRNADLYRSFGAKTVLLTPITIEGERLGVLSAYGEQAPLFAEDDLDLLQVLAAQVAVVLRDRQLLLHAAQTRAQEETLRLKDDFLSAAAHDLKTPLTTLVAQSQMMQRRYRRDPEAPVDMDGMQRMVTEAQRMRRLVEDLLDASRSEQSGFLGLLAPLDLTTLAREVAETTNAQSHRIVVDGGPVVIEGDRDRMRQVMANLLDNAIKYSPDAGEIHVRVSADGGRAYLSVTDRGVGVPDEDRSVIFERFQRGSRLDDRRFSGLGLGLYLCKRIVEEHGGAISVDSEYGRGSTFQVALPLALTEGQR
ncbi:MAG: ATP-binding protein [Dehalococcoidia bacterium]